MRMIELRAVIPGTATGSSWAWTDSETGEQKASIGYGASWYGAERGSLHLHYTITADGESTAKDYAVPLVGGPMRYGGFRWYCRCPATGRLVSKRYLVQGLFVARTAIRPLPTMRASAGRADWAGHISDVGRCGANWAILAACWTT